MTIRAEYRRRPSRFRKATDPADRIRQLLDAAESKLRRAFIRMITRVQDLSTFAALEPLILSGRIDDALALGDRAIEEFADEWIEVYVTSGRQTAAHIASQLSVIARFDRVNVRAVEAMQRNRLRLIREIKLSQRETINSVLSEGVRAGINPREAARAFRDSIGLTRNQEQYVRNFRAELERGSAAALRRELRDRRFDPTVRRAMRGEALDRATIDKMVGRYRERMVKFRSEVIGRTESLRSVHEGAEQMYDQAVRDGTLNPDELVRIWNTALDDRVRDFSTGASTSHLSMHGQEMPIGQPFVSGAGNQIMYPGDPSAPPEETIQCRCVLSMRFKKAR